MLKNCSIRIRNKVSSNYLIIMVCGLASGDIFVVSAPISTISFEKNSPKDNNDEKLNFSFDINRRNDNSIVYRRNENSTVKVDIKIKFYSI